MLFKIIGVALVTVVINIILKGYKSDFAFLVNICGGLIIFLLLIDGAKEIIDNFIYLSSNSSIKIDIIKPILKVIGIGYITEFTADLADDSNNKSIADKVIMGGKIAICVSALPIIKLLLNTILSIL